MVLINGIPLGIFKSSRGLRQGFPLSTFLFLLIAESLSRLIKFTRLKGSVKGIMVAEEKNLTHMLICDGVVLFQDGIVREWRYYKHILENCFYGDWDGNK
jgi:mannosylglycoprotein endo-beta-mannosidase